MSPLVITTKNLSSQSVRGVYDATYLLLSHAQHILTSVNHRTCICCNYKIPDAENITILRDLDKKTAGFGGLMKCSNLWACPVCARKISEKRRVELQAIVDGARANGDRVFMVGLTHQHRAGDTLKESLKEMRTAYTRWRNGRWWCEIDEWLRLIGTVRALEVTHSDDNGWHAHFHMLFIVSNHDAGAAEIESHMSGRWRQVLHRLGGFANRAHGCVVTENDAAVASYIGKHGEQIDKAVHRNDWSESHELAKQVTKKATVDGSRTPFQILYDGMNGDGHANRLFREYAVAMKGCQQLVYSTGLKKRYTEREEQTDEQLANEMDGQPIASMDIGLMRYIARIGARGWMLDAAAEGRDAALHAFIDYMSMKRDEHNGQKNKNKKICPLRRHDREDDPQHCSQNVNGSKAGTQNASREANST